MNQIDNNTVEGKNTQEKKPKDYRKLSRIKSVIFLILAVLVLAGMYLKEKPGKDATSIPVEAQLGNSEQKLSVESVSTTSERSQAVEQNIAVEKNGTYEDKEHVALYIHTFGKLPSNFITKTKAKKAGWVQEEGNLRDVLPGMSIGGGPFQNEEGILPKKEGRNYYECDIDYQGGQRNEKRIVYSDDGLIYYTGDHYKTFELLYGEEK